MSIKQEQIEKLLNAAQDLKNSITQEEFLKAFEQVVDTVNDLKVKLTSKNDKELSSIKQSVDQLITSLKSESLNELTIVRKEISVTLEKAMKEQSDGLNFIHDKVKDLRDGFDADEDKIADTVLERIEIPEQKEETAEEHRDKLETLEGDERIDVSAIKGLEELLEKKKLGAKVVMTGQNPGSIIILDATGAVNGSNTAYTFAQKPLFIIVNGSQYRESNGWSWGANDTATLDFAPATGSDIYGTL